MLDAGARVIHVDVMDGHFVPPITMGPLAVDALAERVHGAGALLDVHLMIERPERQIAEFVKAGADNITIHAEATPHLHYAVSAIKDAGCRAGVALCPATPVELLSELAEDLDLALCMTVNPGWGGQMFLPRSPGKIERLRALIGPGPALEVDGGVDARTAGPCAQAGATRVRRRLRRLRRRGPGLGLPRDHGRSGGAASRIGDRVPPVHNGVAMALTVLIVDDHPSFRASARVLLEAEGFDVIGEAADGASGIVEAKRLLPDLVLLDVQLPDIDGFDVASRLSNGAGPAIVLVSSRDSSDFGPLVARSGARGFVPKAELSGARIHELL